jgi:DNA polymerase-1
MKKMGTRMKYKGFFSEEKDISIDKVLHKKNKKSNCEECGLFSKCISPMMDYSGKGRKKIMEIAEAPGGEEDKRGTHFVGDVGEMLRDIVTDFNVDIDRDWHKDNTLACRPPKNRTPKKREIVLCRPRLFKNIEKLKPKKIILFGKAAVSSLMEDRIKIDSIGKWTGRAIPDQKFNAWIFPTYHPSYLYRDRTNVVLEKILRSDIENAIKWDKKFVKEDPYKDIKILKSSDDIITYLSKILEQKLPISLDYETTGLKPHAEGHEIYCASITSDEIKTISFPLIDNKKFHFLMRKILTDRKIKKIAQNCKFEASWTRFILGYEVKGWLWDTMIAAHILDNREASTGLKFQIYVNYGIVGYDDKIKPFLKSHSKNGNAFNRIKKAPINDVLLYCGVDSKYTHKIWKEQEKKISLFLMKGYQLFHNGILEFEKIQANGIRVDTEYYEKQDKHLERRIKRIEKKVQNSDEVRLWKEKTKKDFNIRSPKQIKKLLFNLLEYNPSKQTAKGNDAIDGEVLERIGTDFALNLMEYQRLYKLKNTYLAAFLREPVDGIMRPFFDLHIPRSFRSSSSGPNFQNIPVRNKEAQRIARTGIIPSPGNILLEADFKGIEVCISASYHHDPTMITYITDKSTDMHRDEAMQLFFLEKEQVTSFIRYISKNMWVFPQFYNSYYEQCAPNIWEAIQNQNTSDGTPLITHLKRRGITSYKRFENYTKKCEKIFWYEKFKVYRKWKEKLWDKYQKRGEVKFHTGFACSGLMKRNAVVNYPIQGSAFHCLLWSLIKLNRISRLESWKSKIIGQIHDSIIMDVDPKELNHVVSKIKQVTEVDLRNHWKWINVPMSIEIEISEIDGSWYQKKEIENEKYK